MDNLWNVGQKTLIDALAYLHVSQGARGLHVNTRMAMSCFHEFNTSTCRYRLTHDGLALAKRSNYWVAYEWLKANGYRRRQLEKHSMRSINYWNPTTEMYASISRDGSVFLHPEDGNWKGRTRRLTIADLKKELTNATTVL